MCGRYTLSTPADLLADLMQVRPASDLAPRYNIAPTQEAPIIRLGEEPGAARELSYLRWGLVPFWAKDPSIGNRMINARAETVAEKPSYRASFRKRRFSGHAIRAHADQQQRHQSTPQNLQPPAISAHSGATRRTWHHHHRGLQILCG